MTTEQATRTELAPSTLVLVNYTGTEQPTGVYFASQSDYRGGEGWATLIVPTDDERCGSPQAMWVVQSDKRADYGIPESDLKEYRGWNIPPRDFTVVESPDTASAPDLSDRATRESLPVTVAYPVGSVWNHRTYGNTPCAIHGHNDAGELLVSTPDDTTPRPWTRGALDTYGTLVSLPTGEEDTADDTPDQGDDSTTFGELPTGDLFTNVGSPPSAYRGSWSGLWVKTGEDTYQGFGYGEHYSHSGLQPDYRITPVKASDLVAAFVARSVGIVTGDAGPDAFERGKAEGLAEGKAEAQARWDAWKESATETAHRYAEDNSLCSEFDRCMEAIGLPTRADRNKEYRITYTYTTFVTARDEESAREGVDDYSARHYGEWSVEESEDE